MNPHCNCHLRRVRVEAVDRGRRRLLGWAVSMAVLGPAGVLSACRRSGGGQPLLPAEIDGQTACVLDGMLLAEYPGPKGQIRYVGQAEPEFFCDTVELFSALLAPEQVRAIEAVWVQDMGRADWEQPRGHWIDARSGIYVLGSRRHGSMGPTLASFAEDADARRFAAQHGGRVLRYAEISADQVDLSGGALHDRHM